MKFMEPTMFYPLPLPRRFPTYPIDELMITEIFSFIHELFVRVFLSTSRERKSWMSFHFHETQYEKDFSQSGEKQDLIGNVTSTTKRYYETDKRLKASASVFVWYEQLLRNERIYGLNLTWILPVHQSHVIVSFLLGILKIESHELKTSMNIFKCFLLNSNII